MSVQLHRQDTDKNKKHVQQTQSIQQCIMSVMIFPALLKEEEVDVITHQRTQDCLLIHENGLLANFITLLCLLLFFVFPFFLFLSLYSSCYCLSSVLLSAKSMTFLSEGFTFTPSLPKTVSTQLFMSHTSSLLFSPLLLSLLSRPVLFHFTSRKRYYECVVSSVAR